MNQVIKSWDEFHPNIAKTWIYVVYIIIVAKLQYCKLHDIHQHILDDNLVISSIRIRLKILRNYLLTALTTIITAIISTNYYSGTIP